MEGQMVGVMNGGMDRVTDWGMDGGIMDWRVTD